MPDHAAPLLFLAVPGTQETRQLDLESVREAVARGEIGLDNWAWSAERSEWVPLAQLPEFAAPAPAVPVAPMPMVQPQKVAQAGRPVRASSVPAAQPVVQSHARTHFSKMAEDHPPEFPILRIGFFGLAGLIVALVVVNYFLVDQPVRGNLSRTPFAAVAVHAHLGAFLQPQALLIHVRPSSRINSDNFADFLSALTEAAPKRALPGMDFQTVSLTPGWLAKYTISGADWESLAEMTGFSADQKKQFVLSHLERAGGAPLLIEHRNESAVQQQADEDKAWQQLVATFQAI